MATNEMTIHVNVETPGLDEAREKLDQFNILLDQVKEKADAMGIRFGLYTEKA